MMSDEYRGWAWTRAFLGLQADEVHVCGDPSAVPLLRSLCAATGDILVQNEYERFKPLTLNSVSCLPAVVRATKHYGQKAVTMKFVRALETYLRPYNGKLNLSLVWSWSFQCS